MDLRQIGWDSFFESHLKNIMGQARYDYEYIPGRVSAVHSDLCQIWTEEGEITARISGKLRDNIGNESASLQVEEASFPAVGDWVLVIKNPQHHSGTVRMILPRKTKFSRNAAGAASREQVVATNIDFAFIVASLNSELNTNRLERYLVAAWNSGAVPVILLNKADLCPEAEEQAAEIRTKCPGVALHVISAVKQNGLQQLDQYLNGGRTGVFLGSSGVGKSTIINRLLGDAVIEAREISPYKDKGRHTTTSRGMYLLGNGGLVIDTPGMRELQLWSGEDGLSETFADIETIAGQCRFRDCRHQKEPGCAVRAALEAGDIDPDRYRNYLKLQRELKYQESQNDARMKMDQSKRWKDIAKARKQLNKGSGHREWERN